MTYVATGSYYLQINWDWECFLFLYKGYGIAFRIQYCSICVQLTAMGILAH